jgi:hypothetical protein
MRLIPILALAALPLVTPLAGAAQPAAPLDSIPDSRGFSFYARGPYRASVPRPETLLGFDVGDRQTQFAWQERVLLAIADAAKDRVRVEEIGRTNELRTMRLYLVSHPDNIARLDAIRADLDRLADPRDVPPGELDAIVARVPAVVMVNESVHGNEAPGFEAAMQTLYHLAASEEPATLEALRNVLVVLNPSTNPDGHERFAVWYNSIGVHSPAPYSMEKDEPWSIQGRFNHYRFDMNRDVMTTTQREAKALVRAMLRWHPMVAIDQHGQTTNYFFPPTAAPMNDNLARDNFQKWMEIYGRGNAAAFDRHGWMYYSRDVFDFYGPFYWDSWPSLTGAIGMTYETDGGGWKGILWRRDDGSLLSNRDGIAKHYTTALATIETTAQHRADRVRDWLSFRQGAVRDGRAGTMKRVVLVPGKDPGRAAELVATLLRGGIEVRRADAPFSAQRAHAFRRRRGGDAALRCRGVRRGPRAAAGAPRARDPRALALDGHGVRAHADREVPAQHPPRRERLARGVRVLRRDRVVAPGDVRRRGVLDRGRRRRERVAPPLPRRGLARHGAARGAGPRRGRRGAPGALGLCVLRRVERRLTTRLSPPPRRRPRRLGGDGDRRRRAAVAARHVHRPRRAQRLLAPRPHRRARS